MFGKIFLDTKAAKTDNQTQSKTPQYNSLKNPSKFAPFPKKKIIKKDSSRLQQQDKELQGAKFRLLNEMLYTTESKSAVSYFQQNRQDFQLYHEGYRHQANKWEYKPVDQIIDYLLQNKSLYLKKNIADLGCGQGFIFTSLVANSYDPQRIKSYDLISTKPFIQEADISKLPLKQETISLCIFCLSLMGTNYIQFLKEARRVLKPKGQLIISEVESRSPNWRKFTQMVCAIGFQLINNGLSLPVKSAKRKEQGRFFRTMHFRKSEPSKKVSFGLTGKGYSLQDFSRVILQSCTYKRR